ncbi:hypothetical protein B0T25DRAFT_347310 [Lasiosphaeria hispida]|uniref:Uncharacterized protein n=1 Tax=Lasiosphaeria hispida TaxID=260671 RepID=A0AAJ0H6M3_9PEZI|nr:hypothetical protein B0T25DRAFT_347310 [Lasiosphaeria hispida]
MSPSAARCSAIQEKSRYLRHGAGCHRGSKTVRLSRTREWNQRWNQIRRAVAASTQCRRNHSSHMGFIADRCARENGRRKRRALPPCHGGKWHGGQAVVSATKKHRAQKARMRGRNAQKTGEGPEGQADQPPQLDSHTTTRPQTIDAGRRSLVRWTASPLEMARYPVRHWLLFRGCAYAPAGFSLLQPSLEAVGGRPGPLLECWKGGRLVVSQSAGLPFGWSGVRTLLRGIQIQLGEPELKDAASASAPKVPNIPSSPHSVFAVECSGRARDAGDKMSTWAVIAMPYPFFFLLFPQPRR